jgi:hypothetical protein
MRHYDDVFQSTVQFAYTGVVAVGGPAGTLLQVYGPKQSTVATASLILVLSWLTGVLVVMSLAKNRVYFARVARYVNEIRHLYLVDRPAGIENKARIYADYTFPLS